MSEDESLGGEKFDERSLIAAEVSLGLLSKREELELMNSIADPTEFKALVEDWDMRLASLGEDVPTVEASAATLDAINSRLFGEQPRNSKMLERHSGIPFWNSLWLWRGFGLTVAAAMAVLLLFGNFQNMTVPGFNASPGTEYVLALQGEGLQLVAVLDQDNNTLRVKLVSPPVAASNDIELWAIKGSDAPVSVGVVPHTATTEFVISLDSSPGEITFAASLEPKGGSPTGAPTGPVLAASQAIEI